MRAVFLAVLVAMAPARAQEKGVLNVSSGVLQDDRGAAYEVVGGTYLTPKTSTEVGRHIVTLEAQNKELRILLAVAGVLVLGAGVGGYLIGRR